MRLSIITPSYQQAAFLAECLASVAGQSQASHEHIVVDGGSSDGSRAIIEAHQGRLAWWCSESDRGQAHAINKGLAHVTGVAFTWVNSDDALLPGALDHVTRAFSADPERTVVGGQVVHRDDNGDHLLDALNDATDERQLFRDPVINQPATWYRTDVVRALGGVDEALRYVMDLELWWQVLFRHGHHHMRFDRVPLAMFRLHGASKTVAEHTGFLDETAAILHGMCLECGLGELAGVLAEGHRIRGGLRGVPVDDRHRDQVKGMVIHFLLKWHGRVHRREQFHMMKRLRGGTTLEGMASLNARMLERWNALEDEVAVPSWTAFRLRRKWRTWRG